MDTFDEPKQITEAQKMALARMYADADMLAYLNNAVNIANSNVITLMKAKKVSEAESYVSRMESLQQLIKKGNEYFTHFEKIRIERTNKKL